MRIEVRFFAICREITGCDAMTLDLPDAASGEDFWRHIIDAYPRLADLQGLSRLAVNMEYVDHSVRLQPGDEICIIPPVSGG